MTRGVVRGKRGRTRMSVFFHKAYRQRAILMFLLPGVAFYLIFAYIPLYGLIGAFQKYNP
ncbi:MAG: sugar ABC transporter permease, partial [Clostridiales bacterium]|nr:sugar ABC transporter permease [Clostridiales bacterium]